jgi:hypothetical protein
MARFSLWLPLALVVCWLCVVAYAGEDYYAILGIPRDAGSKQIRKAFRELSLKWHPDKNPGNDEAKAKYQQINNGMCGALSLHPIWLVVSMLVVAQSDRVELISFTPLTA